MSKTTKSINDTLLRFHNEIIEFYNYIKPSKKVHSSRMQKFALYLFVNLKHKIKNLINTAKL